MKIIVKSFLMVLSCLITMMPLQAFAEDAIVIEIEIKDHKFTQAEIKAPAGKKLKLIVYNADQTVEEFESADFNREKIVPPGKKVNIILAPLKSGKYNFYGEFHQDTAKGVLIIE